MTARKIGFSSFSLKVLAIAAMVVDHAGVVLFPDSLALRVVGRLAFPIFAFLICEGYFHTRNFWGYVRRLALFALISEIPFDLMLSGGRLLWDPEHQNIFFTLLLGLLTIEGMERLQARRSALPGVLSYHVLRVAVLFAGMGLALLLRTDYDAAGVVTILIFYVFRGAERRFSALACVAALQILTGAEAMANGYLPLQAAAALAVLPIGLYNGKRGPALKYFFYAFYPLHILALVAISRLV